mmetsp:Transcript_76374/g.192248  ORF Transcript_76374/g.192248 Transcript_76374/m.192248 type:complete len:134 (+) Transcript_76374:485-886(+)
MAVPPDDDDAAEDDGMAVVAAPMAAAAAAAVIEFPAPMSAENGVKQQGSTSCAAASCPGEMPSGACGATAGEMEAEEEAEWSSTAVEAHAAAGGAPTDDSSRSLPCPALERGNGVNGESAQGLGRQPQRPLCV